MLHGFEERFPTRVLVWPVRVQGGPAPPRSRPPSAASTRSRRGPVQRPDVLIVARRWQPRGPLGPSDEAVVRAAAESAIPLIPRSGTRRTGRCWTTPPTRARRRRPRPPSGRCPSSPISPRTLPSSGCAYRSDCAASVGRRGTQGGGARVALARGMLSLPRQRFDAAADRLERCFLASLQKRHTRLAQLRGRLPAAASLVRLPRQRFASAPARPRALPTRGCTPPAMRGWPACGLPCSRGGFAPRRLDALERRAARALGGGIALSEAGSRRNRSC